MRLPIQWGTNIVAPDSDYPSGRTKDIPNGTAMNEKTMGDIQQFFFKLFRLSGLAANGLPDNEYNGNQYMQAFNRAVDFNSIFTLTGLASGYIVDTSLNQLVSVDPLAANGWTVSLDMSIDKREFPKCRVCNNSPYTIGLTDANGYNINGSASPQLQISGERVEYFFDRVNLNWVPA